MQATTYAFNQQKGSPLNIEKNVFRMWIRRVKGEIDRYELKVSIANGKAFLRTTSFAGVGSTPVFDNEILSPLTTQELAQSSLVYVDQTGKNVRSRIEYQFDSDTDVHLKSIDDSGWTNIHISRENVLNIAPAKMDQETKFHNKQSKPIPTITKRQTPERKNAAAYIEELEANLERSTRHIEQLKKKVAALELQIEALGGTVAPTILRYTD